MEALLSFDAFLVDLPIKTGGFPLPYLIWYVNPLPHVHVSMSIYMSVNIYVPYT